MSNNPHPDEFHIPQYLATRYLRLSPDKERVIPRIVVREMHALGNAGMDPSDYPFCEVSEYKGFPKKSQAVAWQSRELTRLSAKYPGLYVYWRLIEADIL